MLNKVFLIGRVGNDLVIQKTKNGFDYCRISLVTFKKYTKNGEKITEDQWHSIKCYGKQAELVQKYSGKGLMINVVGSIKYSKYQDKNGVEKNGVEIIADEVNFIDFKKTDSSKIEEEMQYGEIANIPDGELPF